MGPSKGSGDAVYGGTVNGRDEPATQIRKGA